MEKNLSLIIRGFVHKDARTFHSLSFLFRAKDEDVNFNIPCHIRDG